MLNEGDFSATYKFALLNALADLSVEREPADDDPFGGGAQRDLPDQLAAFGINGVRAGGFRRLFMSHPPISERVAALQRGEYS